MERSENSGRLIVITGGGSGIGKATGLLLAARGDTIAILDKNGERANEVAQEALERGGCGAIALACDVSDERQVTESFARIHERFGAPYGIFANAGIDMGGLIHEMPIERWKFIVDTNLTGVFLTCKHGLQQMLDAHIDCLYVVAGRIRGPGGGPGRRLQRYQGRHFFSGALHGGRLRALRHPGECRGSWGNGNRIVLE